MGKGVKTKSTDSISDSQCLQRPLQSPPLFSKGKYIRGVAKMAEVQKQLEIKQSVERNCEELKLKMKEVLEFQREMKQMESTVKTDPSDNKDIDVPVRSQMKRETEVEDPHTVANALKEKGNQCVKVKDFEGAAFHYSAAIDAFPDDPIYYTNRALCSLRLDRLNKCIEDCNHAIALDTKCVKAFYRRMQANESLGNTEAALRDCEQVVRLEPTTLSHRRELDRLKNRLKNERNHTSRDEINNNRKREEAWRGVPGKPWSRLDREAKEVDFVEKKPHLRSKKPLKRIEIVEHHTQPEPIPDHIVDKLFNNFTGEHTPGSPSTSAFDYGVPLMAMPFSPRPSTSKEVEDDVFGDMEKFYEQKRAREKQEEAPKLPPKTKKVEIPAETAKSEDENQTVHEVPATNVQFCSTWKDLTEKSRYGYLEDIVAANSGVVKALGPLLDSVLLSQILATLGRHFLAKRLAVHSILDALATNDEIKILAMFMSTTDRQIFAELMDYMVETKVDENIVVSIRKAFNVAE